MPSEVTIRVTTTGPTPGEIQGKIDAATAGKSIDIPIQVADAQLQRLQVRLDELKAEPASVKVEADIAVAEARIAQIEARRDALIAKKATIQADADTAAAQTELEALGRTSVTVAVKADDSDFVSKIMEAKAEAEAAAGTGATIKIRAEIETGEAEEGIARIVAEAKAAGATEIKIKAKVDDSAIGDAKAAGDSVGNAFTNAFASRMQDINFGAGSFRIPVELIIPAVQALGNLTGILGMIPALAAGAATSLGTFLVGVTGLKDAITAYTQAQDATIGKTAALASQQLAASNSLISASEAVTNARQAVTDAERNYQTALTNSQQALAAAVKAESDAETAADRNVESAARSLQSAEQQLTSAKQAALTAEQNLTNARLAASRALEDAPNKVIDATLAQKQAVLDLQNASNALFAAPSSTGPPANAQALGLAYQQAKQRVDEANLSLQRAKEDAAAVTAAGVDGASQVVAAQQQVASSQQSVRDATQSVGDAQEALVQAQVDGDQKVIDAKQKVIDAQRALTDTEISGDEAIAKAKRGVNDALRSQQAAIASVAAQAESAAGSMSVFNARMADLAPSAQAAIRATIGLGDTWESLRLEVQQHMFAGASDEIQRLAKADLPVLRSGLSQMADQIAGAGATFMSWATAKTTVADLSVIFHDSATAAGDFNRILAAVLRIFQDTGTVGADLLHRLVGGWADAATKAADFVSHARETGQLNQWIQTGLDTLHQLWEIFKNLSGIIRDVMTAPASLGGGFLGFFQLVTGIVKWLLDNMPFLVPILEGVFLIARVAAFVKAIQGVVAAIQAWEIATKLAAAAQWLLNVAMDANPVGLVIIAVAALAAGFIYLWNTSAGFRDFWMGFMRGLVDWTKWGVNGIIQLLNGLIDGLNTILHGANWLTSKIGIPAIPDIPHIPQWRAAGGPAGGWTILGEQGPEGVYLPSGSQVMPAANTAGARGGSPVRVILEWRVVSGGTPLDQAVVDSLRHNIQIIAGGDVQAALGS